MNRPLRPCKHPGCKVLVKHGYCDRHQPKRLDNRSAESREWHSWYGLRIWTHNLRPAQLLREPCCRECAKYGIRTPATDVDHIVPFAGNWEKFIDPTNHQSLCHSCHSRKTAAESHAKMRAKKRR